MPVLTGSPGPAGTWRMQELSFAYIRAVAAAADCSVDVDTTDRDSVDLMLKWKANAGRYRSPRLEAQVKATHQRCVRDHEVAYPLRRKNYQELSATNLFVPRILIVVVMPRNIEEWLSHSEAELAMRRCAYWVSLFGAPPLGAREQATVRIPRAQVFDVKNLDRIFQRLSAGQRP